MGQICRPVERELGQAEGRLARIRRAELEERRAELDAALSELHVPGERLDELANLDIDAAQLAQLLAEGREAGLALRADVEIRKRDHVEEMRLRRAGAWRTEDAAAHWRNAPRVIRAGRPDLQTRAALHHGLRALGIRDRALREALVRLALAPGVYVVPVVLVNVEPD